MAQGMLGSLPPGLRGLLAAEQMNQQRSQNQLGQLGGILSLQNAMVEQQMTPLKMEQLKIAVANARQNQQIRQNLMGGTSAPSSGALAFGEGGISLPGGGQANLRTGQSIPAQSSGATGIDPQIMSMLLSGDPGLKAAATAMLEQQKPIPFTEGGGLYQRGKGVIATRPKLGENVLPVTDAQGNVIGVRPMPGATDVISATTGATEGARAQFDLVQVPVAGGMQTMTRADAARLMSQQLPQTAPQPIPQSSLQTSPDLAGRPPAELAAIQRVLQASQQGRPASVTVPAATPQQGGGMGRIPTSSVVGGTTPLGFAPSEADKSAAKKRSELSVDREAELPQARLQVSTQLGDIDRLISITNETMKSPALSRSVGLVGAFPSIPGQPAANVDSLIESLKAQVSGMKLQAMRNASRTGGAVGQVTEREWPRLENMIVALNRKMSPEVFREKLSELVVEMNKSKELIQGAFDQEYGSVMPPQQRRRTDAANDPLGMRR